MSDITSITALILSVAGITISVLNYRRDTSKIEAWADIIHHHRGPTPDSTTPALRIRIANLGRRPIILLNLAMTGGRHKWSFPLKDPISPKKILSVEETLTLLGQHSLAQNSSVRLLEGEVLDLVFWPDDSYRFLSTHQEPYTFAERLYVEGCANQLFPIKNSKKCLTQLLEAKIS